MRLQLTPNHRVYLICLQILVLILLPIWALKLSHYYFLPIPFLFDGPSMIPTESIPALEKWEDVKLYQTLINNLYFVLFWIQHIIMASFWFKNLLTNRFLAFNFYQRPLYNIVSSIFIFYVVDYQLPQNYIIFELPWIVCASISLVGFWLFVDSNIQLKLKQTHLGFYSFKALIQDKYLEKEEAQKSEKTGIYLTGSYRWIRHPMQFGSFMLFFFGNNVFTIQKCLTGGFLLFCVYLGVWFEEKRLMKKHSQYADYMKQVPYRFIPYIL